MYGWVTLLGGDIVLQNMPLHLFYTHTLAQKEELMFYTKAETKAISQQCS